MSISKKNTEEKFKEIYNSLNTAQRTAVDTLEGPVMVIAGPGTGKTQILAARIGKILLSPDALPENILCLTYTDAGVVAMRKRLQQFIGADAYKVNIYTFHAFCNDVIQDNLSLFEKTFLDPVSDLERIGYFRTLINQFPKNHPLKRYRGDVYYEVGNMQQLFAAMKKEGWTPQVIDQKIDAYLQDLPLRDEYRYKRKYKQYNAGDINENKLADEKDRMEKLRAAIQEFDKYQQLMQANKRYDFDDMINWVIRAFEDNKNLLANYQEQFQYLLVDEFQDTSGTQNKIVQLLINYWEQPNVFVVGDDDQSIYRFQGANVQNMLDFARQYSNDLKTIVLTQNYRSTQAILDVSKSLISNNQERLTSQIAGLSKELVAANEALKPLHTLPEIIAYNTVLEEMAGITYAIESLITKGVAAGRIAVIYKENKYGEELAQYLAVKGIPVYSKRNINLLHQPFIIKLINVLRYLNAEHDISYGGDELLFEILHYDFYNIPAIEIAKIAVEVNKRKYAGEATSIRKCLHDKATAPAKDLFDTGLQPSLKTTMLSLEALIGAVPNLTLQQLIESVIQNGGILSYTMNSTQQIELMQQLTAFFDFIKEENRRNPVMRLQEALNLIDLMEKEKISLPMMRATGNDKGVNLLTAHGSKGLEFEYVFLAGTNATHWEKKRKPGGGYKLPDTLFSSQPAASDEEELRRVFYVALTRAEKELHISYAKMSTTGKEMEPSQFIAEILDMQELPIQNAMLSDAQLLHFQQLQFTAQAPVIENAEADFVDALLQKFVMNVTALNNYLSCPLKFYYQNLIRIPSGKNEATAFGSAVHYALERLFKKLRDADSPQGFAPVATVVNDFAWYMQRHRENFTSEAFARRMEQGAIIIPEYYNKYVNTWNKIVAIELNVRGVVVNGVPLKGKLDKLEFDGKDVNVVDYKTGDVERGLKKMKAPSDKEPAGGDYWRQAVFYKLLLDNYELKDWRVVSTEFDFIEPDKNNIFQKEKIIITSADTTTVKQQLTDTWHKIQNKDFYKGCGKKDCHWCNFVKDNHLYIRLEDNEPEEEER